MKQAKKHPDSERMKSYLEHVGGIHEDQKTRDAYARFKRPVWYLRGYQKKDGGNDETGSR